MPTLVQDRDPTVCAAFQRVIRRAFFSPAFRIDLKDAVEPRFSFVFAPHLNDDDRSHWLANLHRNVVVRDADLDQDGRPEMLAIVSSPLGWRDTYGLMRFSAADAEVIRGDARSLENETWYDPDRSVRGLHERGWSGWEAPTVIEIGGRYFFAGLGEEYRDRETVFLARIPREGDAQTVCEVRVRPPEPLTGLSRGPVARLYELLGKIGGNYGACGTLNTGVRLGQRAALTRSRAALRPWALLAPAFKPYNERNALERDLARWGRSSLSTWRLYRRYPHLAHTATGQLATYYREAFGLPKDRADRQARRVADRIIRAHFVFPAQERDEDISPAGLELRSMLLRGGPQKRIRRLLRERPDLLGEAPVVDGVVREAPLFFALEHPALVRMLLDAGASVDPANAFGKTPLMYAAQLGLRRTAKMLLARGADPNARTASLYTCEFRIEVGDRTPLMYAAENASPAMIRLLVERGADRSAVDSRRRSGVDYLDRNEGLSASDRGRARQLLTERRP